jgi:hypothetical protein
MVALCKPAWASVGEGKQPERESAEPYQHWKKKEKQKLMINPRG